MALWRVTRQRPPELDVPPLPAACAEVFAIFQQLSRCRGSTGFGPAPLGQADVWYWQKNRGVQLTGWEHDCIQMLDALWLQEGC